MTDESDWYFDGKRWWAKALRFLNLLEDGAVKLSLTGFTLWATTLQNLHAQIFTHDIAQQAFGVSSNAMGLIGHVLKRWTSWRHK